MMVFMPERTVVAKDGHFVKMFGFFVDSTCQALLADQLETGQPACRHAFHKKTANLRSHQIYIKVQKYCNLSFSFFDEIYPFDCSWLINRPNTFGRCR